MHQSGAAVNIRFSPEFIPLPRDRGQSLMKEIACRVVSFDEGEIDWQFQWSKGQDCMMQLSNGRFHHLWLVLSQCRVTITSTATLSTMPVKLPINFSFIETHYLACDVLHKWLTSVPWQWDKLWWESDIDSSTWLVHWLASLPFIRKVAGSIPGTDQHCDHAEEWWAG